jgi:mRNA interferase MazF
VVTARTPKGVVKRPPYVPDRGDVVTIDFDSQAGHEQKGRRPALVVSPMDYNEKVGLALLCPITSAVKGYPFEVPLPKRREVSGVVLADQIKNLDWKARNAEKICSLPDTVVHEVLERLAPLLNPDE